MHWVVFLANPPLIHNFFRRCVRCMTQSRGVFMMLVGICLLSPPQPCVAAAKPSHILCASHADIVADDLDVETSPATLAIGTPPSASDLASSKRMFEEDVRLFVRDCASSDPNAYYVAAVLEAWKAWLLHYYGTGSASDAELAIQMLTSCASRYYASPKGAACEVWQKHVIRWQQQWEAPAGDP